MNVQLKKAIPMILVAVLAVLLFAIRQCKNQQAAKPANVPNKEVKKKEGEPVDREKGFDRRITYLEYSNHAKCRMQCRKISEEEVEQIMQDGKINYKKSDIENTRCPRYAVEGVTNDDQKIRIVFAQCNDKTAVVTVIDLKKEWTCDCPGDDKKYDNKN